MIRAYIVFSLLLLPSITYADTDLFGIWLGTSNKEWKSLPKTDRHHGQQYKSVNIIRLCKENYFAKIPIRLRKNEEGDVYLYNKYKMIPVTGQWTIHNDTVSLKAIQIHTNKLHKKFIEAQLEEAKQLGYERTIQDGKITTIHKYSLQDNSLISNLNIYKHPNTYTYQKYKNNILNIDEYISCGH